MELLNGFLSLADPLTLALMLAGVVVGLIFGAIPGLSAFTALALMLPITFGMTPVNGLAFMIAIYIGGVTGGLVSAILLGIPGTPSSVATVYDGFPMAKRGEGGKALGVGIVFSFIGGLTSALALAFFAPTIAKVALRFSPYEYFSVIVLALTTVASLASGNVLKGLIACLLGISISFVGVDRLTAYTRYTFGNSNLDAGFSMVPLLIGIFAVSQILGEAAKEKSKLNVDQIPTFKVKGFGFSIKEFLGQWKNALVSLVLGTGIGILPGIGGNIANLMAYSISKKRSKYPEKYGTGIIDGIVASETSNNATIGGALIVLLTLGIPGDNATAMILAGFLTHGIAPGPLLFAANGDLVQSIFAATILANIMMLAVAFFGLNWFVKVLKVPKSFLLPVVIVFCIIGSYSSNSRIFDIVVMMAFGFLGFALDRLDFPTAPLVVGFILAPMLEENLRRSMMRTGGSIMPIFTSPMSLTFLVLTVVVIFFAVRSELRDAKARKVMVQ